MIDIDHQHLLKHVFDYPGILVTRMLHLMCKIVILYLICYVLCFRIMIVHSWIFVQQS